MTTPTYVLEMKNISKEFPGVKALDDLTLQVRPGTVHALMGENGAGKSTLMKCLFGIYQQDAGEIFVNGEKVNIQNSSTALNHGISMIHQELHPIPHRNVMENLWIGRIPTKGLGFFQLVDSRKMEQDTIQLFQDLEMDLDPHEKVGNLSVSKVQSIEIAKAVSFNSKIIVMDEPTSSLTSNEVEQLIKIITKLKSRGVAIIYISHKMEEILRISDDVTIMRDGKKIGTWEASELTTDLIISRMVGRDLTQRFPDRQKREHHEVLMKVENFTSVNPMSFQEISFDLRKGEILGIGGLVGAKRTELIEAIFGLEKISSGKIEIHGKEVKIKSPLDAKKYNIALLTEERRTTGIFPQLSILENTTIANQKKYEKFGLLNDKARLQDTIDQIEKLRVKTPSHKTIIQNLSGGNQQKVLLGRWLLTEPEILLLDEPTRGIDVGAKFEIYTIITELAKQGKAIMMISSEMPELIGMSDRIMVMSNGRLSGILDQTEATEEKIMSLATKYMV
ncbi:sugar ABC transporter ATP-binding protein [Risungbinella massiliensis]|uniref:sugar ABC transporter ATP-binding protein n=1 Tax=Risungbinella massiliensis TaxID=1329796 RepID=UPI0005CB8AA2|nr:sugar ABC transporter ATP-binding protein [Risungbinella massiliensis]